MTSIDYKKLKYAVRREKDEKEDQQNLRAVQSEHAVLRQQLADAQNTYMMERYLHGGIAPSGVGLALPVVPHSVKEQGECGKDKKKKALQIAGENARMRTQLADARSMTVLHRCLNGGEYGTGQVSLG